MPRSALNFSVRVHRARWRTRHASALALIFLVLSLASPPTGSPAHGGTHVGGTLPSGETIWNANDDPYVVDSNVTIPAGATLTIQPGVVVKFNGSSRQLLVYGTLRAEGDAANRIFFTSIHDDAVGGDSNGNGGATSPAAGQWASINVRSSNASTSLKFVDVRYGGDGTSNTGIGAVDVSNGSANIIVEDGRIYDNERSGLRIGANSGATVRRTIVERNANGISAIEGWLQLEDRSFVRNNTSDGVYFSLTGSYSGVTSVLKKSDVRDNARYGVNLSVTETLAAPYWPNGQGNNIFGNTSRDLHSTYKKRTGVDWTGNYWGEGVDYAFNPAACYGVQEDSRGHVAWLNSQLIPPDGPIRNTYYIVGTNTKCGYDYFTNGPSQFSRHYIDGTAVPQGQILGHCRNGIHAINPTVCGSDPVNTASGSFTHEATDVSLPGIGVPFLWTRSYNSQDLIEGVFGKGWTHSYNASLSIKGNGDVTLRGEDGQLVEYVKQQDGSLVGAAGALSNLTKVGNEYDLVRHDQVKYHFDSAGKLTSMKDRNNKGLTFAYDGSNRLSTITDSAGRVISLTYTNGNLTRIALPAADGRSVNYAYTSGKLTSVTDLRGNVWTYTYEPTYGFLEKQIDPNQHTVFRNVYSAWGRVTDQYDALNRRTIFAWNATTQTTTITDARNKIWKDVYSGNKLIKRIDPLNNITEYAYDSTFNVREIKTPRGHTTTMTYDSRGNLLTRTPPLPFTFDERFTYDAKNNLLTAENGRDHTTTYDYDSAGNLITITQPGNAITRFERDPGGTGLVKSITDPRGKVTQFEHDSAGNVTAVVTPLGKRTTMAYDTAGRMTSRVEPRGNVQGGNPDLYRTSFTYDAADHLRTVTTPLGHVTEWQYDPAGNLTKVIDAKARTTEYRYDAADRLDKVIAPITSIVTDYDYDEVGNLVTRTDPKLHMTTYAYDDASRLTSVVLPGNRRWSYEWDANGNRSKVIDANGNATSGDPNDGTTTYAYDELNRLTALNYSDTTPDVSFTYDANGNRLSMADGAGIQSYSYDSLDRLTSVTRGSDAFSYEYDGAGNITKRTYPGDRVIEYAYTADGELDAVTSPATNVLADPSLEAYVAGSNETWGSAIGAVPFWTVESDANARTGSKVARRGPGGVPGASVLYGTPTLSVSEGDTVTAEAWVKGDASANGRVGIQIEWKNEWGQHMSFEEFTVPATTSYQKVAVLGTAPYLAATAHVRAVARDHTTGNVYFDDAKASRGVAKYGYDPAGNLQSITFPGANGYREERQYDRSGRLTMARTVKVATFDMLATETYTLDEVGNPTTVDAGTSIWNYKYDNLDRLTEVCYQQYNCTGANDPFIRWTYDAVGNRLTEARPAGTTTYNYNDADELTSTTGLGGTVDYTFDQNGNQTQAGSRTFSYDLADRLKSTTLGGSTTTYSYDGAGVRLQAASGASTVNYLWDVNNALPQLALERNGSGGVLRSYLRGSRMISMDAGGSTSYFHYDGLGSVTNLTSTSGVSQWRYAYEPFGGVRTATQDDPAAPENVLRFAEELRDSDTALYHLRARQYDPANGRFSAIDPLTPNLREPYISTYAYAKNRPTILIDPSGMGSVWSGKVTAEGQGPCLSPLCWVSDLADRTRNGTVTIGGCLVFCGGIGWELSDPSMPSAWTGCCGVSVKGKFKPSPTASTQETFPEGPYTATGACALLVCGEKNHTEDTVTWSFGIGMGFWHGEFEYVPLDQLGAREPKS